MAGYGTGAYGGGTYAAGAAVTSIDPEDARISRVASGQEDQNSHPRTFTLVDPSLRGTVAWHGGKTFTYGATTTGTAVVTQDAELVAVLRALPGFVET